MLIQTARPQVFSQVAGQTIPVSLLKSIVKDPYNSPKSLILSGGFGCGKTSLARIFARTLNCEHVKANGDACMKCSSCLTNLDESPYYAEYDSSQLKLDTMRNITDQWYSTLRNGWTVRVLDESHLLSKSIQSALLKITEEPPERTFIVFCTTDIDKMMNTIRSRSLEILLSTVSYDDMKKNLEVVASANGIEVDDEVLDRIIKVSKGHMRNAHMELDKFSMLGKETYLALFKSAYDAIDHYFVALAQKNQESMFSAIDEILQFPLANVHDDFDLYVMNLTKSLIDEPLPVTRLLGANTLKLVKLTMSDWFRASFSSDVELQAGLLCLYQIMSESTVTRSVVNTNPHARR